MAMVELPDETMCRLEAAALRRGVRVETLIEEFAAALPSDVPGSGPRRLAFGAIGETEHGITDRIDDLLADGFGRS
ncbi:MAG: hypothetical protein AAGA99_07840 [Actinomycetota bacterium]